MEQRKQPFSAFFKKKQNKIFTPATDKTLQQNIFNSLLCPQHSEQIHHLCFTCDAKLLCARCFNKGQHVDHEVKPLEKAYMPIMNNLNQFLIRLRSKADLLSILHQKISHSQIEQYQQSETIKQAIICQYQQISSNLQTQKQLLLLKIDEIIEEKTKAMDSIMTRIRQSVQESMVLYKRIQKNVNQMQGNILCTFFSQVKKQLDKFANEDAVKKFKNEIPSTKLEVDLEILQNLSNQIKQMEIFSDCSIQKNSQNAKLSKKKLRKNSKFPIRNIKESLPQSPRTPKSKERITVKNKGLKSPTEQIKHMLLNKNFSMPASPDKRQYSPQLDKEIQKKKNTKKKTTNS